MKRITEIDGLRGIAAVFVMLFHYTFAFNSDWSPGSFFHYGYMGVSLFFIISGFVISKSINNGKSIINFCYGRFVRLYPIYWITIIITVTAMLITKLGVEKLTIINTVVNFTMFQRFIGFKDIDGSYWTLAVELIFYFILIILQLLKKTKFIVEYFIFLILLVFIIKLYYCYEFPFNNKIIKILKQFSYLHLFLAGIIFNEIYNSKFNFKYGLILVFCLICNFGVNLRFNIVNETIIVFFIMVIFLILTQKKELLFFLNNPLLQFLGKISYPLYLLNEIFGACCFKIINNFCLLLPIKIVIVSLFVILMSSLVHFYIEIPIFKILRKIK